MRGPDDAIHVLFGRQRHWTNDTGARPGDRLYDLARRGVNRLVVVGLEPDADLLSRHASPTSLLTGPCLGLVFVRTVRISRAARWLCRRCLPVCGSPVPAVGCVAPRALSRGDKSSRSRWGPDAPVWAPVVCPVPDGLQKAPFRLRATRTVCPRKRPAPNPWPRETDSAARRAAAAFLLHSSVRRSGAGPRRESSVHDAVPGSTTSTWACRRCMPRLELNCHKSPQFGPPVDALPDILARPLVHPGSGHTPGRS